MHRSPRIRSNRCKAKSTTYLAARRRARFLTMAARKKCCCCRSYGHRARAKYSYPLLAANGGADLIPFENLSERSDRARGVVADRHWNRFRVSHPLRLENRTTSALPCRGTKPFNTCPAYTEYDYVSAGYAGSQFPAHCLQEARPSDGPSSKWVAGNRVPAQAVLLHFPEAPLE